MASIPGSAFLKGRERIIRVADPNGVRPTVSINNSTFAWTTSGFTPTYRYFYGLLSADFTPGTMAQEFYLIGGDGWRDSVGTVKMGDMSCSSYLVKKVSGGAVQTDIEDALSLVLSAQTNPDRELWVEEFNYLGTQAVSGALPIGADLTITTAGLGYTPAGIYKNVPLTSITGSGSGARVDIAFSSTGAVVAAEVVAQGSGYANGDTVRVDHTAIGMVSAPGTPMVLTIPAATVTTGTGFVYYSRAFCASVTGIQQGSPPDNLIQFNWTFQSRADIYVGKRVEGSQIVLP